MKHPIYIFLFAFASQVSFSQEVPIINYAIDENGSAQIEIASSSNSYYVLYGRYGDGPKDQALSIMLGKDGTTTLADKLSALPLASYRVEQYQIALPSDTDQDGLDDIFELRHPTSYSPFNAAPVVGFNEGAVSIPNADTFDLMTYKRTGELFDERLKNLEFVKFYMYDLHTDNPKVYFINTENYPIHGDFALAVGLSPVSGGSQISTLRGQLVYNPETEAASGKSGVYNFEFQPRDAIPFGLVQVAHELLAANMPFLENNLSYLVLTSDAYPKYLEEKALYQNSRIPLLFEEDLFGEIDYLALNVATGFGLLQVMAADERPNPRDIVIYESLPNELPRVGGIITTVIQTPLSHVNLRAIQDKVPNAFIRNALENDTIASLVGKYVFYEVAKDKFSIREASHIEVENHYEDLRPTEVPTLIRDLSQTQILPLDEISFEQSKAFGVKCANLAAMRKFGFPEGTIPDGFGVPFYFYDEFMRFNGFYAMAQAMIEDSAFINSFQTQADQLKIFRKEIEKGAMPDWMLNALEQMQESFPEGTGIRCRSSTNNEDLPGFNGAGLYDSKTQHIDEGHISKSIKEVYASMWNFRAFDERQFYRIDHFLAAMGVLVHPHFDMEKANGVGVTFDPFYGSENTFYINTQIGESLVTNPDVLSVPEEILLHKDQTSVNGFTLIRPSNQAEKGELVLGVDYQDQLREFLQVIEDEFRILYNGVSDNKFGMDIEYKVDSSDLLVVKQARPWTGGRLYTSTQNQDASNVSYDLQASPNPFHSSTSIAFILPANSDVRLTIHDSNGALIKELVNERMTAGKHRISWNGSTLVNAPAGIYICQLHVVDRNGIKSNTRTILRH